VGTVGIDAFNRNNVYLFPNPTTGKFKVDLGTVYNEVILNIRTITGQLVQTRSLNNVRSFETELKESAGIYVVELNGSTGLTVIYRMVKE